MKYSEMYHLIKSCNEVYDASTYEGETHILYNVITRVAFKYKANFMDTPDVYIGLFVEEGFENKIKIHKFFIARVISRRINAIYANRKNEKAQENERVIKQHLQKFFNKQSGEVSLIENNGEMI